jgi:hypothetical protein
MESARPLTKQDPDMTDSFDWRKNNSDQLNAFREGWQAACNLHLRRPEGPGFHEAWLESDTFSNLTDDEKSRDPWLQLAADSIGQ